MLGVDTKSIYTYNKTVLRRSFEARSAWSKVESNVLPKKKHLIASVLNLIGLIIIHAKTCTCS